MKFDEVLRIAADQGASYILKMSAVWYIVYRPKNGKYQSRSLNKTGEEAWHLGDHMVGGQDVQNADGWQTIKEIPARAKPLELPEPEVEAGEESE